MAENRPGAAAPPLAFTRDTNGTEADWHRWLPGACAGFQLHLTGTHRAEVTVGTGRLSLHWEVLPPRQIALARLPRLAVHYRVEGVSELDRSAFMRRFDLYMQRGGG